MKTPSRFLMAALALGLGAASQAQTSTPLPYIESFEQGAGGWTFYDMDGDGHQWLVLDLTEYGDFAAMFGYSAYDGLHLLTSQSVTEDETALTPENWAVSPVIDLGSVDMATDFTWYAKALAQGLTGDYYEVRLAVVDDASQPFTFDTADFGEVLFGDTLTDLSYVRHSVSLAAHQGESVRIAFRHGSCSNHGMVMIDLVGVGNDDLPMAGIGGPLSANAADTITLFANPQSGTTDGLQYTWLADEADYVEVSEDGDSVRLVFDSAGTYTIGLAMSNSAGTDTAWHTITVVDCSPIEAFPWHESFDASVYPCWHAIDADMNGEGWTMQNGVATSSSSTFFGFYPQQDNWLVTPAMVLDHDSVYLLTWKVSTTDDPYGIATGGEHYSVLAVADGSHTDTAAYTELFGETLSSNSTFQQRQLMLQGLGSDTVRLAFRHHNCDGNGLHIDNLMVASFSTPIVDIVAPQVAFIGDSTCFGLDTIVPGEVTDITWRVQIDPYGGMSEESTLEPFCFLWDDGTEPGTYMVYVEVSNENGTTTDSVSIEVVSCPAIDTFPYSHTFGADEYCWSIDAGWNTNTVVNGTTYASSMSVDEAQMTRIAHDNHLRTPRFAIPGDGNTYELKYRIGEALEAGDRYTLTATTADGTDTLIDENLDRYGHIATRKVNLDAYAGREVRFDFRHHDSPAGYQLLIGDMEVRELSEPEIEFDVPSTARNVDNVTLRAHVASAEHCDLTWTLDGATFDTDTAATVVANWAAAGTYTIKLEVNTPSFYAADSITIVVTDCNMQLNLPVAEEFDQDLGCWRTMDLDGDSHNWELLHGGSVSDAIGILNQASYNQSANSAVSWSGLPEGDILAFLFGGQRQMFNTDNILSSPAINLGNDEHYTLRFMAASLGAMLGMPLNEQMEVLLATSEPHSRNDYSAELIPLTTVGDIDYREFSADLSAYRGQTVYIGIRHLSSGQLALLVDHFTVESGVGIDGADAEPYVDIYPNPAVSTLNISAGGLRRVEVYDMTGRMVASGDNASIDVSKLTAGVYHVRVMTDGGNATRRFVKQ